jgi:uncharacterized repeat protein (TIGR01451 family)
MSSRGTSFALSARSRKSLVLFWIALFVLSIGLQYAAAATPASVLAAGPVVTQEQGVAGCNGVVPTPGSENTNKRLVSGSLEPGGTATFEISFPVDASDVGGDFAITDCVFIDNNAAIKYTVAFVPNTENFLLTFTLQIPAGTPLGAEYCNYAKTTQSPSTSQASNRKAGPACFIVGGNISIFKKNAAGDPLAGAKFHVVCTLPTTQAAMPDTIIDGVSHNSTSGGVITQDVTTGADGHIAIQAPEGTSCVVTETDPPAGYLLPDDPSVTLVADKDGVEHTFVDLQAQPHLSIVKDATEASYDSVGDVIHYTITAKNDGNTTLHNVTVTDPNATGLSCTPGIPVANLAVNATISCTATHTVTQADIDAGHYLNTACVNDGAGGAAEACDDADVPAVPALHLSIDKTSSDASYDSVGDVIHYTIVATNDGNTTLQNVNVTDPKGSNLDCTPAIPVSSLAPGGTINCTATHTVTQADIDAGHFLNTACVSATNTDQACDDADVPGEQNPHLSINKDATESGYSAVGDVIHYSITATNDGNTTLHNVNVTDPNASGLSCTPSIPVSNLAPGGTINCSATHTITQADIDAGSYLNQACVDDGAGGAAQACDEVTTPGSKNPHLTITKDATEQSYDSVGDVIHYSITATNDGNTTLASVTVTDPNAVGLVCTPANGSPLAPGASLNCTASHTVTQADIDAGHYLNTACVDDGEGGAAQVCDDANVPSVKNPHLTITKDATEQSYDSVGDVIHYTITATNDGNTTIGSVTVTDPNAANLVCVPANGSSLAPGASLSCTADHTVTQADIDAGHYLNTACVDDGEGGAAQACDNADVPGDQNPSLSIVKNATESTYDSVGDVIHYTITATNTGNVTLHNVVVTDPNAANLVCVPATPVSSLAPGASIDCTADHTVTQADIDAGHYLNTACVDDGEGGAAQACDDANVPATSNAHLTIVKDATEQSYDSVGDVIHYTITATNDGNTTLNNVTVTDANAANLVCVPANGSSLAPGASLSCTADHTVTQADIDAGHYLNTACVSATGATATCDDADVPSAKNPHLSINKDATETSFSSVGDVIHYTITATNDGNTTLSNVNVTDPNANGLDCTPAIPVDSLAPGASIECTASHTITQADIDAGHYLNTACVDATGATQACDAVDVLSATLTITKTNNAPVQELELPDQTTASLPTATEGSTVTYTLSYTIGAVDVTDATITDVLPAGVTYVNGSASSNDEFTFDGYDSATRTLTWSADAVTKDGTLTYKAKVDKGAGALQQPLENLATIDSNETAPDSATSNVFVPAIPKGETAPPTDISTAHEGQSAPGSSLLLILLALGGIVLAVGFVTPVPAAIRRRKDR